MINKKVYRWGVDIVFTDGHRTTLRDFHCERWARDWLASHDIGRYYPGRIVRAEITRFEVTPEMEGS